jgi:hypothetical protein
MGKLFVASVANILQTNVLAWGRMGQLSIIGLCRGVAQFGRAAVSKTAGRGFESCHPCQIWRSCGWLSRSKERGEV